MTGPCPRCGAPAVTQVADAGSAGDGSRFDQYQCGNCFQRFQEVSPA